MSQKILDIAELKSNLELILKVKDIHKKYYKTVFDDNSEQTELLLSQVEKR